MKRAHRGSDSRPSKARDQTKSRVENDEIEYEDAYEDGYDSESGEMNPEYVSSDDEGPRGDTPIIDDDELIGRDAPTATERREVFLIFHF